MRTALAVVTISLFEIRSKRERRAARVHSTDVAAGSIAQLAECAPWRSNYSSTRRSSTFEQLPRACGTGGSRRVGQDEAKNILRAGPPLFLECFWY